MNLVRLFRHVGASHWRTRLKFPQETLDAIEAAVARAELSHDGEIRFAIETALAPMQVIDGLTPRDRALELFAHLKVWDTEYNNGVLIYVQVADRCVEIIADRGFSGRVSRSEWELVCRSMEDHFRAGRHAVGAIAGVDAVGTLLARHYPLQPEKRSRSANELPDRPALL